MSARDIEALFVILAGSVGEEEPSDDAVRAALDLACGFLKDVNRIADALETIAVKGLPLP